MTQKITLQSPIWRVPFCVINILISLTGYSQSLKTVIGRVTNTIQQPLAETTVHAKNHNEKIITDEDGKFNIMARNKDILIFSHIGLESQEIAVNDQTGINIVLSNETSD